MGVVNVTEDSFFAGSRFPDAAQAVACALEMVRAGADIIDIGGESTRPGAKPVPPDEELSRILPVISELARRTDALISVDTRNASTVEKVLQSGADLINDVSGLSDPAMAELAADAGAGVVLMHMKGAPETMQESPSYEDVVLEVRDFLAHAADRAEAAGVAPESIILDPGIGFGKTLEHNLQILNRLSILSSLAKPILVGTSRKSFLGRLLGLPPQDRLHGTAATVAVSILRGAHLVRVHDVVEMGQVARTTDAVMNETSVTPDKTHEEVVTRVGGFGGVGASA